MGPESWRLILFAEETIGKEKNELLHVGSRYQVVDVVTKPLDIGGSLEAPKVSSDFGVGGL